MHHLTINISYIQHLGIQIYDVIELQFFLCDFVTQIAHSIIIAQVLSMSAKAKRKARNTLSMQRAFSCPQLQPRFAINAKKEKPKNKNLNVFNGHQAKDQLKSATELKFELWVSKQ